MTSGSTAAFGKILKAATQTERDLARGLAGASPSQGLEQVTLDCARGKGVLTDETRKAARQNPDSAR